MRPPALALAVVLCAASGCASWYARLEPEVPGAPRWIRVRNLSSATVTVEGGARPVLIPARGAVVVELPRGRVDEVRIVGPRPIRARGDGGATWIVRDGGASLRAALEPVPARDERPAPFPARPSPHERRQDVRGSAR